MRQQTLTSEAAFEGIDRETEQATAGAEPRSLNLNDVRKLTWQCVKLCNSFLHRWFNLCEVGVEEVFYALLMPHFFAEVELVPVTASQEVPPRHALRLLEDNGYSRQADPPEPSMDRPESAISWRTPWLYLVLLLLVWLLLF
jgi:hypothetical protein